MLKTEVQSEEVERAVIRIMNRPGFHGCWFDAEKIHKEEEKAWRKHDQQRFGWLKLK